MGWMADEGALFECHVLLPRGTTRGESRRRSKEHTSAYEDHKEAHKAAMEARDAELKAHDANCVPHLIEVIMFSDVEVQLLREIVSGIDEYFMCRQKERMFVGRNIDWLHNAEHPQHLPNEPVPSVRPALPPLAGPAWRHQGQRGARRVPAGRHGHAARQAQRGPGLRLPHRVAEH